MCMSRETLIFIIGMLLAVVPSLGIPSDWKHIFYIAAGVVLIVIGYSLRRSAFFRSIERASGEHHAEAFVESNTPIATTEHDSPAKL